MEVIDHIALRVPDLEAAERFYLELFDATLLFREAEIDGRWCKLPFGWEEARRRGIDPHLVFMRAGVLRLGLEHGEGLPAKRGVVSHIGLGAAPDEVDAVIDRATKLGCEIVRHDPAEGEVRLVDPYGMDWEFEGPDLGWADPDNRDGYLDV